MSPSISVTRYVVEGQLEEPILETIATALKENAIREIDNEAAEKSIGWTNFETPFHPDFEGSSFHLGNYLIFSLRIDKKSIPNKMITKKVVQEQARRLNETGRDALSNQEKKIIKEQIIHNLNAKIPATPNVYDLVWHYEAGSLNFFSNLKAANEALESLFLQSFGLTLIRMFPYTDAIIKADLKDSEKDVLNQLTPTLFFSVQR